MDSVNQVRGECAFQSIPADDHGYEPSEARKVQRSLPRRIAASHNEDVFVPALGRLCGARSVVQACPDKVVFVRETQPAVVDARSANGRVCHNCGTVSQTSGTHACGELTADALARQQNFRAKAAGFFAGTLSQISAADPGGKAQIVFYLRAASRLAA